MNCQFPSHPPPHLRSFTCLSFLISVNQNTACSEVGISCFPAGSPLTPLSAPRTLGSHLSLDCFFLNSGPIWPCLVFINVHVSPSLNQHELFESRVPPHFSLHLPKYLLSGVRRAKGTQWSQTDRVGLAPASRLSVPRVFLSLSLMGSDSSTSRNKALT